METVEKTIALNKEHKLLDALMKLSKESTQESQRLHALKLAWTSRVRTEAIRLNWKKDTDTQCGALLEFGQMVIPFRPNTSKKKSKISRRAIYLVAKIGSMVQETEGFVVNSSVSEIRIPDKLCFNNVAPGFICTMQVYGLDLPEKEKIKHIAYNSRYELWASIQIRQEDMTGKLQNRDLQIAQRAPPWPKISGTIEMKLSGVVPIFCEIVKEGFLNMWTEGEEVGPEWKMLWVILKNNTLRGGKDPRFGKASVFQIEITSGLKVSESTRKRANSFQLRDFSGRTILAASSKDEMHDWISILRKQKDHLKRWGKLDGNDEIEPVNDSKDAPWAKLFSGSSTDIKVVKTKRRSKSVDLGGDEREPLAQRDTQVVAFPRRNSGEIRRTANKSEKRDWMTSKNKALPLISPVSRYDPPTICLDKNESLAEDELMNGPGFHELNESINDLLDNLDAYSPKPRRDTNIFHKQVMEETRKKAHKMNPESKIFREPLRTSTQIGDENKIRDKYQMSTNTNMYPLKPNVDVYPPPPNVYSPSPNIDIYTPASQCTPKVVQKTVYSPKKYTAHNFQVVHNPAPDNHRSNGKVSSRKSLENIVGDILHERHGNEVFVEKKKKSLLPKFDHLETY